MKVKAITLISGGLDSILAARLIKEQGISIIPLNFKIPFCHRGDLRYAREDKVSQFIRDNLGEDLKRIDICADFLKLITNPRHGFGSNINPCIDCKILMLHKCKELMRKWRASFVVTGEVLGQRPMSQHRQALETIERESALRGLILRPLSAKLLSETLPEQKDWVKREQLLNFSGRTRKPQIGLAARFGIKDFPNPAGGCLLTDPQFSKRMKDILEFQELDLDNIELLKIGRHFRLAPGIKLVVGRNESENMRIERLAKSGDYLFMPEQVAGPTALGRGDFNAELLNLSLRITCRYCDSNGSASTRIAVRKVSSKQEDVVSVLPLEEDNLKNLRI